MTEIPDGMDGPLELPAEWPEASLRAFAEAQDVRVAFDGFLDEAMKCMHDRPNPNRRWQVSLNVEVRSLPKDERTPEHSLGLFVHVHCDDWVGPSHFIYRPEDEDDQ
jgi:hypothetical protein